MNIPHIAAVSLSLFIYTILTISYFGWGSVTYYFLGLKRQETKHITLFIWIGWSFTLLIFQILHLIFPLKAYVTIPIFILGLFWSIYYLYYNYKLSNIQISKKTFLLWTGIFLILIIFSIWISSRAMLSPVNYDSGLYHFNKIRWINSFPIVPGLGNLHGRLAFNQSFFTYVASLNFYPYFCYGYSIANSFLLLLVLATFVELLFPVLKNIFLLIEPQFIKYVSILISFPIIGYYALFSNGISSPSPDLTSSLMQLTMIVVLAYGLCEWKTGKSDQNLISIYLCIMAVTSITIKLSNIGFSLAIILFFLLYMIINQSFNITLFRTISLCVIMIIVWILHSVILSGAPLYPSTFAYLSLEWSVPFENIRDDANWVFSWSRQPQTHWSNVLGNWNWFYPWFNKLILNLHAVTFPLLVSLLFLILTGIIRIFRKNYTSQLIEWSIFLPPIIGLTFWFITAPDIRFANAMFFIFPICSALLFLSSLFSLLEGKKFFFVLFITILIPNIFIIGVSVKYHEAIKHISLSGWQPIQSVPLIRKTTSSGLVIYTPERGDQCWDSPLPSTPYFNEQLQLINTSDMAHGFKTSN